MLLCMEVSHILQHGTGSFSALLNVRPTVGSGSAKFWLSDKLAALGAGRKSGAHKLHMA